MNRSTISCNSEDLEVELIEAYDKLDKKDARIRELEEELASANSNKNDNSSKAKRSCNKELKKCQKQLHEYKQTVTDLQAQLQQAQIDQDLLLREKANLDAKVDEQKEELVKQKECMISIKQQSEEAKKTKKDQSDNQYRLEVENAQLRSTIKEHEENEADLVTEVETLEERMKEHVTNEKECIELRKRLVEATGAQEANEREISSLSAALDKARKENAAIEEKAALSYGAQKQKALQNEINNLRQEVQRGHDALRSCSDAKNKFALDLESTRKALVVARKERDERTHSAIVKERTTAKNLEARLEAASLREKDLGAKISDLQSQKRELERRNKWYEEGHGLADAVMYQKKLEGNARLRDHDLTQLKVLLEAEVDKCRVLQETCVLLKEKGNLMDDPIFEEEAVKDAMKSHDNQLKSQNAELCRQNDNLEAERLLLMKQLRHNAAEIGEKGIKFLGLDASQIQKVIEFASNIRNGSVALPLDDRSKELKVCKEIVGGVF